MSKQTSDRVWRAREELLDAITDELMETLTEACHVYLMDQQRNRLWQKLRDSLVGSIVI